MKYFSILQSYRNCRNEVVKGILVTSVNFLSYMILNKVEITIVASEGAALAVSHRRNKCLYHG